MLRTLPRLLLILVVALAIPLQGYAAATAGMCMAMGEHHQGPGQAAHDQAADSGVHGHALDGHEHPLAADHAVTTYDSAGNPHCPPCASCCAAAAIAPALRLSLSEASPSAAIAAVPYAIPGVTPDQLDRPPLPL